MNKTINYICGLPRSGSTLICNVLCQNPRFHATATSGCMDVIFGIRNNWTTLFQHQASPCPNKLQNVLKAALYAYYNDIDKDVIFDKSRGWLPYIELVESFTGKKMKVIVPIRPIPDILASFEMLYRETSKTRQPPGESKNYTQFQTIKGRCDYWMRNDQVVGISLNRIEDAMRRGFKDRIHFVDFNKMTSDPESEFKSIYNFIGEDYFPHNFNYVEQVTSENDEINGFVDLHKIRNNIEPVKSRAIEILGPEIVKAFQNAR